jgi:predicted Zn-ribbon and HTH transcriptional regulator
MKKIIKIEGNRFVVDGEDVARNGNMNEEAKFENIIDLYNFLLGEGATKIEIFVDMDLTNEIDDPDTLNDMIRTSEVKRVPKREDAEKWILKTAKELDGYIISKQNYDLKKFSEKYTKQWYEEVRIQYSIEDHHIRLIDVELKEEAEEKVTGELPVADGKILHSWEGIFFQMATFKTKGFRIRGIGALTPEKLVFKGSGRGGKIPFVFKKFKDKEIIIPISKVKSLQRVSGLSYPLKNGFVFRRFIDGNTNVICRFLISKNDNENNEQLFDRVTTIFKTLENIHKGEEIPIAPKCKNCGAEIRDGASFCHECGAKLEK